jgi:hypothetical protein
VSVCFIDKEQNKEKNPKKRGYLLPVSGIYNNKANTNIEINPTILRTP